jgi:hypothetical protein
VTSQTPIFDALEQRLKEKDETFKTAGVIAEVLSIFDELCNSLG